MWNNLKHSMHKLVLHVAQYNICALFSTPVHLCRLQRAEPLLGFSGRCCRLEFSRIPSAPEGWSDDSLMCVDLLFDDVVESKVSSLTTELDEDAVLALLGLLVMMVSD